MSKLENHNERMQRAVESLEGLAMGDAFGEQLFLSWESITTLIDDGEVSGPPFDFVNEEIVSRFIAMHRLLPLLARGDSWQNETSQLFGGQGSFGNGAAMRVAPLGAYFADDLDACIESARRSAEVTHAHPEGVAGAIAVALGAAWAWRSKTQAMSGRDFLNRVLEGVPESEVRQGLERARDLMHEDAPPEDAAEILGSGQNVTAQDTVPFVLWSAGSCLENYEEALWQTVAGLGDRDTTCAMAGGIVALSGSIPIPGEWLSRREELPEFMPAN